MSKRVIVPVGSKGGFVSQEAAADRCGARRRPAEGIECYKIVMRGLLTSPTIMPARDRARRSTFVRSDDDDPISVLRADKWHGDVIRPSRRASRGLRFC